MTSSNGHIFRVTGHLCGEFTGLGEFPAQRPVMPSFHVFFDLRLNKGLSKQTWGWWFETPSWSLWPQCNVIWNQRMKYITRMNQYQWITYYMTSVHIISNYNAIFKKYQDALLHITFKAWNDTQYYNNHIIILLNNRYMWNCNPKS